MDKHWKEKWVEALRSGDYSQGKQFLCIDDSFCCLGVLCDIYPAAEGILSVELVEDMDAETMVTYRVAPDNVPYTSTLPPAIRSELNIDSNHINRLMAMNDTGAPFSKIADYIEENL